MLSANFFSVHACFRSCKHTLDREDYLQCARASMTMSDCKPAAQHTHCAFRRCLGHVIESSFLTCVHGAATVREGLRTHTWATSGSGCSR